MKATLRMLAAAAAILIASAPYSAQVTPSTLNRTFDPVEVPGELLSALLGKPIRNLRLFSFRDGSFKQMLYQVDERLEDGTFILELGEKTNQDQANLVLDRQDLLVFRAQETGDRVPRGAWLSPHSVEIEIVDPGDGGRSWCYLTALDNPPARLAGKVVELIDYDPFKDPAKPLAVEGLTYQVRGRVNSFYGRYYKTAVNQTLSIPPSAGGNGKNIIDGQRMRAYADFRFGVFKVEASESTLIGGIEALHQGPVRGLGRQWLTTQLPFGIEGPRVFSDVFTYDRMIVSPMRLTVPINPGAIITRAGIEFGYDFNHNAAGMRFYCPNCPSGVVIDGKMSEAEKNMSDRWVPWYLVTGEQGSFVFRVAVDPELLAQTDHRMVYIDDLAVSTPLELEPGSMGHARTIILLSSVEPASYDFQIEWYFPPHLYEDGGYNQKLLAEFLDIKDKPLLIAASGKKIKNRALSPPPIKQTPGFFMSP